MHPSKIDEPLRLAQLEIENFGLIARATLAFSSGFTVCSGETGSGKTMLLGALGFVLGERTPADLVRAGAERARVTLAVETDDALLETLGEEGFEADRGEQTILVRDLSANGKSTARINGRLATSAQLRTVGDALVERIGQHEQQRLLERDYQRDALDTYAGPATLELARGVATTCAALAARERELAARTEGADRSLTELADARYALDEIDAAAIVPAEDAALRERRDYLVNVERIRIALSNAHEALAGGDAGAIEALGAANAAFSSVARFGPELGEIAVALTALQSDARDAALALARELDATDFDSEELELATARLDQLERLKKKYGGSLDAIAAARAAAEAVLARESTRDERGAALRAEIGALRGALEREASALSASRVAAAARLEAAVAAELGVLAMPAARFAVRLEPERELGPTGAEYVELALSPTPGEPLRPLGRAASGGELSRVLLALAVVLSECGDARAIVFDEVDAGIGGATATAVGVRLGRLALATQVLCVTHLAQIASWADRHYALRKRERDGATIVELVALDRPNDALEELARMLSGTTGGVALEHAEMLRTAARAHKLEAAPIA